MAYVNYYVNVSMEYSQVSDIFKKIVVNKLRNG
jgi:hypothetical protein